MDFFEAAAKRYSHRGAFTGEAVPREDLIKLAQAGLDAPSGCNAQTPVLVIIDDPAIITKLRALIPHDTVNTASAVIVVATRHFDPIPGMNFETEDYAAATENILLAATAMGYASLWLDGILRQDGRAGRVAQLLDMPPEYTVRVLLPVGVPVKRMATAAKKPFEERVWFNAYQKA